MAPKAAMKRPASAARAPAAKAPRTQEELDPTAQKCQLVAAALTSASGVPEAVLASLKAHVAILRTVKEDRHRFEAAYVDMVEEVLFSVEKQHEAASEAAKTKTESLGAAKVAAEADQTEAEERLTALQDTAAEQLVAADVARAAAEEAEATLAAAKAAQESGDAELEAAGGKKAEVLRLKSDVFTPVKDWTVTSDKEAKGKVAELVAFSKCQGLDATLIGLLPLALKQPPSKRSGFDALGIQQFDEALETCLATLEATLQEGGAATVARAAAVHETEAAVVAARAAHQAATAASLEASAAVKDAKTAVASAAAAATTAVKDLVSAEGEAAEALAALSGFREQTLAAFAELRDLVAPPPPVEEEKPEEMTVEMAEEKPEGAAVTEPTRTEAVASPAEAGASPAGPGSEAGASAMGLSPATVASAARGPSPVKRAVIEATPSGAAPAESGAAVAGA